VVIVHPTAATTAISLNGIGGIVGIALALIGAVAVAVSYYRASYSRATIDTLKDSNAALTERVELLEDDMERCSSALVAMTSERDNLRSYVAGTEAINALAVTITEQHLALMRKLEAATRDGRAQPRRPARHTDDNDDDDDDD
jgi:septal ring factor EnvC (AmiA/AmiB activator)